MSLRVCAVPGCPTIGPGPRCPAHTRQRNTARSEGRGTTTERGYGAKHQALRRAWAEAIDSGEHVDCWRCGEPITARDQWDLGHDDEDRDVTNGPEHARECNRSAAGRHSAH